MKKVIIIIFTFSFFLLNTLSVFCSGELDTASPSSILQLKIGNPSLTINGIQKPIDQQMQLAPIIKNNRALVPVRTIAESLGGSVKWNADTQTVIIIKDGSVMEIPIGKTIAKVNGIEKNIDVAPIIVSSRTMLPLRFLSENMGYNVQWIQDKKEIVIKKDIILGKSTPLTVLGTSQKQSNLIASLTIDQKEYILGEPINLYLSVFNNSNEDIELFSPSSKHANFMIDQKELPHIALTAFSTKIIKANTSFIWHKFYSSIDVGQHTVNGFIVGTDITFEDLSFNIVQTPLPKENFKIDFESLVDGTLFFDRYIDLNHAYASLGVHFKSTVVPPYFASNKIPNSKPKNDFIESESNINATFDMPVYGVSSRVSSVAGVNITMIARDSNGDVISKINSNPIESSFQFTGPLEILSKVPIASCEWLSSDEYKPFQLDDVNIKVT